MTRCCALSHEVTLRDIPRVERLFLWAIRTWCADHGDVTFTLLKIQRAFKNAGIDAALPAFQQMMTAFFCGLRAWPDIRPVNCLYLGEAEIALLHSLAALQAGNDSSVRRELRALLERPAVREVWVCAAECIRIATARGLRFMQPSSGDTAPARPRDQARDHAPFHLTSDSLH